MSDQLPETPVIASAVEYAHPLPAEPERTSRKLLVLLPLLLAFLGLIVGAAIGCEARKRASPTNLQWRCKSPGKSCNRGPLLLFNWMNSN